MLQPFAKPVGNLEKDICDFCKGPMSQFERCSEEGILFHQACLVCDYCSTNPPRRRFAFQRDENGDRKCCLRKWKLHSFYISLIICLQYSVCCLKYWLLNVGFFPVKCYCVQHIGKKQGLQHSRKRSFEDFKVIKDSFSMFFYKNQFSINYENCGLTYFLSAFYGVNCHWPLLYIWMKIVKYKSEKLVWKLLVTPLPYAGIPLSSQLVI